MKWHWAKRPRWLLSLALALSLLAWLFWPIEIYGDRHEIYIAVSEDGSRQFLGTVLSRDFPDPWLAAATFEPSAAAGQKVVGEIGDDAYWTGEVLHFRMSNLTWQIDPAEEIRGAKAGDTRWREEIEELARNTIAKLRAGTLEGTTATRVPRAVLWGKNRYPILEKKIEALFEP